MSDSIFLADGERGRDDELQRDDKRRRDDERRRGHVSPRGEVGTAMVVRPTEHARGPWDPRALHGGAPAALITSAFERMEPGAELRIARLGFQFLRPVPLAPLELSTRIVRPGRRVQELVGELIARGGPAAAGSGKAEVVCRASALRVREIPPDVPSSPAPDEQAAARLPGPDTAAEVPFALNHSTGPSFAMSGMEMRWLDDPHALGPKRVWMRLRHPLLPGLQATPLARLAATADFGNGVSAALPFERFLFINADLTIQLQRPPRGEWIGLDARTLLHSGGTGLAESVLHDLDGPVGRAFQTLVVEPR
ncbi:MAG TPA: thioesterase family protein [Solirubrobacteraceae bacterium]|nr:thioesterase family protein [Solirubrobacteraceae bacterium]